MLGNTNMPEVVHIGQSQHFGKLLAQPNFHLVFGGINSVFGQAAGFDVAVEDYNLMPSLRNFLCREESCRSRAYDEYRLHSWVFLGQPTRWFVRTCFDGIVTDLDCVFPARRFANYLRSIASRSPKTTKTAPVNASSLRLTEGRVSTALIRSSNIA